MRPFVTGLAFLLCAALPVHAQSDAQELATLRADLRAALVRIEMLERAVLSTPPGGRPLGAGLSTERVEAAPQSFRSAPAPAPVPAARESARGGVVEPGYTRGSRGGCYTVSASGRKRYVDRSHCGG